MTLEEDLKRLWFDDSLGLNLTTKSRPAVKLINKTGQENLITVHMGKLVRGKSVIRAMVALGPYISLYKIRGDMLEFENRWSRDEYIGWEDEVANPIAVVHTNF